MLFWLKKVISYWLMPLPVCIVLIAAAWCLMGSERRARLGRRLLSAAALLLLLFSNVAVSTWLVRPLEKMYPALPEIQSAADIPGDLAGCRFVVVLGGGHGDMPGLSAANKLWPPSLARIDEAVRILRFLPGACLIVSGPGDGIHPTHASILAQAAVSMGVDRGRIRLIDTAHDTEDEANAVKALVGDAKVALVTSAWHMPRAAALFRDARVDALPCPVDYSAKPTPGHGLHDFGWDVDSLERSTHAVHERLGLLWLRLRGKG